MAGFGITYPDHFGVLHRDTNAVTAVVTVVSHPSVGNCGLDAWSVGPEGLVDQWGHG